MIKPLIDFIKTFFQLPQQQERIEKRYTSIADEAKDFKNSRLSVNQKKQPVMSLGMAMLDVISSSLGIILTLVVIYMNIKVIPPPPLSQDFLLFEAQLKGVVRLGFAVRHENGKWAYIFDNVHSDLSEIQTKPLSGFADSLDFANTFSGCTNPQENKNCSTTVTRLFIDKPAKGKWQIEPFLYKNRQVNGKMIVGQPKDMRCYYWTRLSSQERDQCIVDDPESDEKSIQFGFKPVVINVNG